MKWTKEIPTSYGWYWRKNTGLDTSEVVFVSFYPPISGEVYGVGSKTIYTLSDSHGQNILWCKIPQPE